MNMLDSDKECCTILAKLLVAKGVKRVVLSPGSRNAPLIVSFARREEFEKFVVLDERSAAFMAMGIAQQSGDPVAVVCTSGTALLNYAPAVAEAYYQHIPLIVISADRPEEWIDQEDSQTLRQKNLFASFVKASYSLPSDITCDDERWWVNRLVNDAVNLAVLSKPGPVHINIPLREPLYCLREVRDSRSERVITSVDINTCLNEEIVKELSGLISRSKKVMILASFGKPDSILSSLLNRLSSFPQVIVLTETISNLRISNSVPTIDRVLSVISDEEKSKFSPDLLITFGGSLVSRMIKQFLRKYSPSEHWSLDENIHVADTMQCMTRHIRMNPVDFFSQIIDYIHPSESDYHDLWIDRRVEATYRHECYLANVEWSDLKAFSLIFPAIPRGSVLQLSNSTPVRYAQLFEYDQIERSDCNRGVSGIDGATSTAVGVACVRKEPTVFITGDMGFLYDSNALWNRYVPPTLKIIVMKNGGGGIFRFIQGSSELPELEEYFETVREVDVEGFARLHGFDYYVAASEDELRKILSVFFSVSDKPAILSVETPRTVNDRILRGYFKR